MYKGFKHTFASATMPMRIVVGKKGARESMTSWGKLVAILDAVPARKSVVVMAMGPEGLSSDIENLAELAPRYDTVTIYIAMCQMPEWICGRLGPVSPQHPLAGGWTYPHPGSQMCCWSIVSLDRLLSDW